MDILREAVKNEDGTYTVTTKTTYSESELRALQEIVGLYRDLAGVSQIAPGVETFDNTAMIAMTVGRKRAFCDGADLIQKLVFGE